MDHDHREKLARRYETTGATKKGLASVYNLSTDTLSKWIEPYLDEIGPLNGTYIYTPAQVKKIYELIGTPY